MAIRKNNRREINKRARKFSLEVKEAGLRIRGKITNKKNQKKFKKEAAEAVFRVKDMVDEVFPKQKLSKLGYAVAIIVNFILIYIFDNMLFWDVPFLTSAFVLVLWAFNLSFLANITINIFYLFYDETWFRNIGELASNIFGFNVMYQLSVIYPFDFGILPVDLAVKLGIFLSMIIIGVTIIYRLIKLLKNQKK
jgi:hypothetical protein